MHWIYAIDDTYLLSDSYVKCNNNIYIHKYINFVERKLTIFHYVSTFSHHYLLIFEHFLLFDSSILCYAQTKRFNWKFKRVLFAIYIEAFISELNQDEAGFKWNQYCHRKWQKRWRKIMRNEAFNWKSIKLSVGLWRQFI